MRLAPNAVNDSRELAIMIYSSFIFVLLRFAVYLLSLAGNSLPKNHLQATRSIFCSLDTIANIIIFFPRVFREEKKKKEGLTVSGLNNPHAGQNNAMAPSYNRQSTALTRMDTGMTDTAGDRNPDSKMGAYLAGSDIIYVEEEGNEEDSDIIIKFRTSDKVTSLPKWVLSKYGTEETITASS